MVKMILRCAYKHERTFKDDSFPIFCFTQFFRFPRGNSWILLLLEIIGELSCYVETKKNLLLGQKKNNFFGVLDIFLRSSLRSEFLTVRNSERKFIAQTSETKKNIKNRCEKMVQKTTRPSGNNPKDPEFCWMISMHHKAANIIVL